MILAIKMQRTLQISFRKTLNEGKQKTQKKADEFLEKKFCFVFHLIF